MLDWIVKEQEELQKAINSPYFIEKSPIRIRSLEWKTNGIYKIRTYQELERYLETVPDELKNFAIHRWIDFRVSSDCEYLLTSLGFRKEPDIYNKQVDVWLDTIPFDVKVTPIPEDIYEQIQSTDFDDEDKFLACWFYRHQSNCLNEEQEQNRLFITVKKYTDKINLAQLYKSLEKAVYSSKGLRLIDVNFRSKKLVATVIRADKTIKM